MAVRRVLAHSSMPKVKKVSAENAVRAMADKAHAHSCPTCRHGFRCMCSTPLTNPACRPCRGLPASVYDDYYEPRECCVGNTAQVTSPDEIGRYDLAGPGPWFRCQTCFRHHGRPITGTP